MSIGSAGEVVALDLFLELGGVIRGRVETADGVPRFFHVLVTPAVERVTWGNHYAFEWSPDYEVKGLPDGAFKIGAYPVDQGWSWPDPPPDGTVWYPGTTDWESAGVVEIREAAVVTGVDIEMR